MASVIIIALGAIAALNQVGIATTVTEPVLFTVLFTAGVIIAIGVGGGLIKPMQERWERMLSAAERETNTQIASYQQGRSDAMGAPQPAQQAQTAQQPTYTGGPGSQGTQGQAPATPVARAAPATGRAPRARATRGAPTRATGATRAPTTGNTVKARHQERVRPTPRGQPHPFVVPALGRDGRPVGPGARGGQLPAGASGQDPGCQAVMPRPWASMNMRQTAAKRRDSQSRAGSRPTGRAPVGAAATSRGRSRPP